MELLHVTGKGGTMREDIIKRVLDKRLIAIVRGVYGEDCLHLAQALYDGGIELMEVTFDQSSPERFSQTSDTVRLLISQMGERMSFGAGTVTSLETLELAERAGAQFIVSPDVNENVIKRTVADGLVSMPGAMTPSEILTAYEYGADFIKLFPVSHLGSGYIKAIRGPINHVPLLAVGGVNEANIGEFIKAGCCGAGIGGNLVNKEWIAAGEFDKITRLAASFVEKSKI